MECEADPCAGSSGAFSLPGCFGACSIEPPPMTEAWRRVAAAPERQGREATLQAGSSKSRAPAEIRGSHRRSKESPPAHEPSGRTVGEGDRWRSTSDRGQRPEAGPDDGQDRICRQAFPLLALSPQPRRTFLRRDTDALFRANSAARILHTSMRRYRVLMPDFDALAYSKADPRRPQDAGVARFLNTAAASSIATDK